jgi:hypothetical protein
MLRFSEVMIQGAKTSLAILPRQSITSGDFGRPMEK